MNIYLILGLLCGSGVMLLLEKRGVRTTLALSFKGDIKRETQWLAQYGQSVCTAVAAMIVWSAEPAAWIRPVALVAAAAGASVACFVVKRLTGRVRPNRENAGKFLGPSWRHANWRESFPSSHSACAVALTVALAALFPPAAGVFWGLAIVCALLRYVLDAHWPSDVLGGVAVGYVAGWVIFHAVLAAG